MRRTFLLTSALGVVTLMVTAPISASAQAPGTAPVVEAARQVTTSPNPVRLYLTPSIAVDPDDPNTVAVSATDARSGGACGIRVSQDGGDSWVPTAVDVMPDDLPFCVQRNFGPIAPLEFASDGTLYMGLSGSSAQTDPPHPNGPITALISRTSDLGRSHDTFTVAEPGEYSPPSDPSATGFGQHRISSLAVDPNDPDTVYRGWREWLNGAGLDDVPFDQLPERSYVASSHDGGETWTDPSDIFAGIDTSNYFTDSQVLTTDFPSMVVDQDGTVYAFTKERPPRAPEGQDSLPARLLMSTSTDGGATWTPTAITQGVDSTDAPVAAIDPNDGTLYLTWAQRGDSGDNPSNAMFMSSGDSGATWSDPINITDDDPQGAYNQYFPGISVAPNGRIDIAWHDYRNDPFFSPGGEAGGMGSEVAEEYSDVYYTYSNDGGRTWAPNNIRVTDRSIDRNVGASFNNMSIHGPIGLASTNDAALVTWPDSRAGDKVNDAEDVYFTKVRFDDAEPAASSSSVEPMGIALGGGAGLLLAGLLLLLVVRFRRGEPAVDAPADTRKRSKSKTSTDVDKDDKD